MDTDNKKKMDESEKAEELPPSIKRRRKENLYRYSNKGQTFDIVIIILALFVAFFMVKTKGCNKGIKNFANLMVKNKNSEHVVTLDATDTGQNSSDVTK